MADERAGGHSRLPLLLLVLLLALAAWIQLAVVSRTVAVAPLPADAGEYFAYAWNLDRFGTYSRAPTWRDPAAKAEPDAMRSPGYPWFLRLAGRPEVSAAWLHRVALLQAALGIASVLLTWLLARKMTGRGPALLAGLLVAINPWLVNNATNVLTETVFTFLLLASVLASIRAFAPGAGRGWALFAGLVWGACSLVRPAAQFLPLLFLIVTLLLPRFAPWRRQALLMLLGFALAWSPWALRNQRAEMAETSSYLMVASIAHGSYPGFMYEQRPESFAFPYRHDPHYQDKIRDLPTVLRHIVGEFRREPLRYAGWYLFGKPYYFLSLENVQSYDMLVYPVSRSPWYEDRRFDLMSKASRVLHWPLVLLGLVGIAFLAFRPRALRLAPEQLLAGSIAAAVTIYAVALHVVVAPFPRYGIPFRPLLFALALMVAYAAWRRFRAPGPAP